MPLVEALVGSHAHTVYDAIFDVELSAEQEQALFEGIDGDEDDEGPALRSLASRDSMRRRQDVRTRTPSRRRDKSPTVPGSPGGLPSPGVPHSPRRRIQSDIGQAGKLLPGLPALKAPSPLARLFAVPRLVTSVSDTTVSPSSPMAEEALAGVRKLETVLESIRDLPVQRLKDEMKELQVRNEIYFNFLY